MTQQLTLEVVAARPERYDDASMTVQLVEFAEAYAKALPESEPFQFLSDMRKAALDRGLSIGQARGVLNCIRARVEKERSESSIEIPGEVINGHFTVVTEEGRRTFRISTRRSGERCIGLLAGSCNTDDYQKVGTVGAKSLFVLKRYESLCPYLFVLVGDPRAALSAYGLESGRCGVCNRILTVPESIQSGIGPVCATRVLG